MTELPTLGAALMRRTMTAYHDALVVHRRRLNLLNVYPVPDADTGTNLMMTMESVVEALRASDEGRPVGAVITRGALLGARGASGVILSQILAALVARVDKPPVNDATALAASLNAAADAAYEAVTHPVEGTILTVAQAAATAASAAARDTATLADVVGAARSGAAVALARTPDQLPELRAAGVVDAGGAGFLLLLDALTYVVTGAPVPEPLDDGERPLSEGGLPQQARYEVVVYLEADPGAMSEFRTAWDRLGNSSTVVVEAGGRWVAHTHTDDPDAATAAARATGRVVDVQITDLVAQIGEIAASRRTGMRSGVVAVVEGDGLRERFRSRGATAIVIGGQTRNPSTAELLDAVERTGAAEVVILPNDSTVVPAANQVGRLTETPVAVVPTRTVLEGLAALSVYDGALDGRTNRKAMISAAAGVRSGSVTRAVRDAASAHGAIREGDWLALTPDTLVAVAGTPLEAAQRLIEILVESTEADVGLDAAAVTIVAGADADDDVVAALGEWTGERWPALSFQWFAGSQLLYPYLVGVAVRPSSTG